MAVSLREQGQGLIAEGKLEPALACFAEAVRRTPGDHRSRLLAAHCMAELGERERALTVLHTAAEGLLGRDYLLSAMAACKLALHLNPVERRVLDTLRRIHARASSAAQGKAAGPPPLPPEALFDGGNGEDLSGLLGEALSERAFEVLASADPGASADPTARAPLPLFADLEREAFVELVQRMSYRELKDEELICTQGEQGEEIFVLIAGKAEVIHARESGEEQTIAFLTGGALIGEVAVILGAPRTASVRCVSETDVFAISRDDLAYVAKGHPEAPRALAAFAQRRMAKNLLATAPFFTSLSEAERAEVFGRFTPRVLQPGEKVLVEGALSPGLFLVLGGELVVEKNDPSGGAVTLRILREGDVAGEISLLTFLPATATVASTRKTAVAFLSREDFMKLGKEFPQVRQYLEALSQHRLAGISAALMPAEVLDADALIVA